MKYNHTVIVLKNGSGDHIITAPDDLEKPQTMEFVSKHDDIMEALFCLQPWFVGCVNKQPHAEYGQAHWRLNGEAMTFSITRDDADAA